MANWFETVTMTLGDSKLSRRQAIRTAAGIAAGAALAAVVPGEAFAATGNRSRMCKNPGTCTTTYTNCGNNQYNNCYCFQKVTKKGVQGVCGCNTYCATFAPCSNQAQCPRGYVCITNTGCGCTASMCLPRCTKTCQLDAGRSGRTAV